MAGRHVFGDGRVLAVAARTQMHGDPLALGEDLDGTAGEPHLDLRAGEAIRNAIKVPLDIDMVIDADPAQAPFGEDVGLHGQGLERWPVASSQPTFRSSGGGDAQGWSLGQGSPW